MRTINIFVMNNIECRQDIIYLIKHLSKLLQIDFDERVSRIGLTGTQAGVLFYVNYKTNYEKEEVHQKDIEENFKLAKSTVNGLVSRLLKTGHLIKKNKHRYAVLEISDSGIKAIETIKEGRNKTVDKLFNGYSEIEKNMTLERLGKLIDNLEGGKDDVAED